MKYKYKAMKKAIYSIQFWIDKQGVSNCLETSNLTRSINLPGFLNMAKFGDGIANSKLLDKENKELFADFCRSYLKHYTKNKTYCGLCNRRLRQEYLL